ncbi:MAG TPA: PilC/PilY family type IV pilus protein, partial [Mycobacterium sp.]|nr:PilC/PilY family type IV pilus protein [Mycobacterium sp.]
MDTAHCVAADDTNGIAAPAGVAAGQNIANWFSYYRTRMLMSKSSMMIAFSGLDSDFKFRFGFASINGNGKGNIPNDPAYVTFDDSYAYGGDSTNRLAVVQPFGDGSDPDSQKAKFWTWLANESPNNGTPLRKALQAVGEYYKTSQPWTSMPNDPGYTDSTTQFACRASFTILTTDGFWNGANPTGIGYAAGTDGPTQTVPGGNPFNKYTAEAPFSGGGVGGGVASLADVATYYWENDLAPDMPNEVSAGGNDPATWQHMTTFTIGLGVDPPTGPQPDGTNGIMPAGTTVSSIFGWAHDLDNGVPPATIDGFSWPTPESGSVYNIADLAHAAVNGRGDFFSAKTPQDLADAFNQITHAIGERTVAPSPQAVNASVISLGALSFSTGYKTGEWSGSFWGVTLNADGTVNPTPLWTAESNLAAYHSSSGYSDRKVYTDSYTVTDGTGTFDAFQFNVANKASLDTIETGGLQSPALGGGDDTLDHRIQYLLGDNTYETSLYRSRATLLGAILRSAPVYVAGATGGYYNSWPNLPDGTTAPENDAGAQAYDAFVTQQSTQTGTVYVGANDGMLHAFNAPVPTCSTYDSDTGTCSLYVAGDDSGEERWAFIPRAVYANLGNLTNRDDFSFRPTVDATPVRRDVFFSGDKKWHTILAGGVGVGGRGVYALDITKPDNFKAPLTASDYPASGVLWEFDADMTDKTTGCVSIVGDSQTGSCNAHDLGYTVSQPNIARLADGTWVVLVPNGYFPDCTTPDIPTADQASCQTVAAQVPLNSGKPFSSLFVINAETGDVMAELKTPDITGVTSFGLASPVVGDYDNDQVDDVAFAGDAQGNLWRFDLSDGSAANWTVTLVYQGISVDGHQGVQPITTMPRLFPDPLTNRFMVVFGTGRLLGVGDNSNGTTQSIIAVRDKDASTTYEQTDLVQQYLHEYVESAFLPDGVTPNPLAGTSVRCVTGGEDDTCDVDDGTNPATQINDVPASKGGWYINLYTTTSDDTHNDAGERVVVNPGAIFASNTVVFETLITGALNTDACNPATEGSILALNATSGGPS